MINQIHNRIIIRNRIWKNCWMPMVSKWKKALFVCRCWVKPSELQIPSETRTNRSDKSAFSRLVFFLCGKKSWKCEKQCCVPPTTMKGMRAYVCARDESAINNDQTGKREFIIKTQSSPRKSHHIQIHSVLSFLLFILWAATFERTPSSAEFTSIFFLNKIYFLTVFISYNHAVSVSVICEWEFRYFQDGYERFEC